jgi:bifunctional non-homologous end joining protein LigD
MSLAEYERKRKSGETPEPKPVEAKRGGWRFVVQKHRATRLHYDFRLELDGVLKSWAVPKGPSFDPADKRLAMEVEDHPVDYITFEGRIPEGNYGAGTVMVWDQGSWEPAGAEGMTEEQREAHARTMLEKGDLKFELSGTKLRGSWVLAKMHSRRPGTKGTEWLLIKHRDETADSGYDIDAHDGSVVTRRSMEEIAGDKKSAEWGSSKKKDATAKQASKERPGPVEQPAPGAIPIQDWSKQLEDVKGARKAVMPDSVKPMLATLVDSPAESSEWLYEIKWDGYRALAFVEDGKAQLVSRNQNDLTQAFAELAVELPGRVKAKRALIDGEIVALDEQGRSSFSLMQQRTGVGKNGRTLRQANTEISIAFYAFDLLWVDGWSLMGVALEDRKRLLRDVLDTDARVRYSEEFGDGAKLLAAAKDQGLEGVVAKLRDSKYEQKRSRAWCKVKITQTEECVIGGWTEPKGSREYFGSLVLGLYDKQGQLISVGQAGTGFTRETEAEIFELLKKLETKKNPFANKVDTGRGIHYVKPELVAQIKFTEWTHEGQKGGVKMRAPVFLGLRVDKSAKECKAA